MMRGPTLSGPAGAAYKRYRPAGRAPCGESQTRAANRRLSCLAWQRVAAILGPARRLDESLVHERLEVAQRCIDGDAKRAGIRARTERARRAEVCQGPCLPLRTGQAFMARRCGGRTLHL